MNIYQCRSVSFFWGYIRGYFLIYSQGGIVGKLNDKAVSAQASHSLELLDQYGRQVSNVILIAWLRIYRSSTH